MRDSSELAVGFARLVAAGRDSDDGRIEFVIAPREHGNPLDQRQFDVCPAFGFALGGLGLRSLCRAAGTGFAACFQSAAGLLALRRAACNSLFALRAVALRSDTLCRRALLARAVHKFAVGSLP